MPKFELFALMPAASELPMISGLQFVRTPTYIAVLSAAPQKAIALPQSRRQILAAAARRQAQLEKCMGEGPLIICRPQFFIAPDDLPGLIRANHPLLDRLATRLAGKVQYQITVSWNEAAVLTRFRDSPELAELFQMPRVTPAVLRRGISALRQRLTGQIDAHLTGLSDEIINLPAAPDMLCNAAVLIKQAQIAELDAAIEGIDAIWTEGFQIKQIGPAPAASFALLHPQFIETTAYQAAIAHLGLEGLFNEEAVALARRRLLQNDPQNANHTKYCAEIAAAAARLGGAEGLFVCDVSADDQTALTDLQQVA